MSEHTEDKWDPEPHEKQWFQDAMTGDRGWLVRREGKDCIRLDRPNMDHWRPYKQGEWKPLKEHRPFSRGQITQVAFVADRMLLKIRGDHDLAKKTWGDITDDQRRRWIQHGPEQDPLRRKLYEAIMSVLRELGE